MATPFSDSTAPPAHCPPRPAVVREQPGGESMRAIILKGFGGLDSLVYTDIPKPLPKDGEVVIEVKGFGINHAEMHMRRGEWAEAAEVSGIECVGIVDSCPGGEFPVGAKVAALMGGLGRTINGSYAEYTRVRAANVALIESDLPWSQSGGVARNLCGRLDMPVPQPQPESRTDTGAARRDIVVRPGRAQDGGRRAVRASLPPRAAANAFPCSSNWAPRVSSWSGATWPPLPNRAEAKQIDAVLDLVGNSTILDSLDMLRRGGTACLAGWLGGLDPIGDFNPLLRMASGVNLNFFGSFVFGTPGFPLSDVPLQDIARQVADGKLDAKPSRVFSFDQIHEAHRVMEAGEAGGKMVVVMD